MGVWKQCRFSQMWFLWWLNFPAIFLLSWYFNIIFHYNFFKFLQMFLWNRDDNSVVYLKDSRMSHLPVWRWIEDAGAAGEEISMSLLFFFFLFFLRSGKRKVCGNALDIKPSWLCSSTLRDVTSNPRVKGCSKWSLVHAQELTFFLDRRTSCGCWYRR